MHIHRIFDKGNVSEHPFDLVNRHLRFSIRSIFYNDSICPSLDLKQEITARDLDLQAHFRLILRSHLSLYLSMDPAAHKHGVFVRTRPFPVVNASPSQDKFHKISHRDMDNF